MLLPGSQRRFEVLGNVLRVKCAVPWKVGLLSEIKCFFLREGVRRKQTPQVISQEQGYRHAIISRKSQVDQSLCTSTTAECVPGLKRRRHWPRKKTKGTTPRELRVCQQTFKSSTIIATGSKVTAEDGQSDNQRQNVRLHSEMTRLDPPKVSWKLPVPQSLPRTLECGN